MGNILSPCKGCTERHEACWSNCEKYDEYRAKMDAEKQAKKDANKFREITYGIKRQVKNSHSLRLYTRSKQGKASKNSNG
jgi:hypothetical protein